MKNYANIQFENSKYLMLLEYYLINKLINSLKNLICKNPNNLVWTYGVIEIKMKIKDHISGFPMQAKIGEIWKRESTNLERDRQ